MEFLGGSIIISNRNKKEPLIGEKAENEGAIGQGAAAKTSMLKLEHEASKLVLGHLVSRQRNSRV